MEMIKVYPKYDWAPSEEAEYFLKALHFLKFKLQQGRLGFFFDENFNLLGQLNAIQRQNMVNFLSKAIKNMEESQGTDKCKEVWMKYFKKN